MVSAQSEARNYPRRDFQRGLSVRGRRTAPHYPVMAAFTTLKISVRCQKKDARQSQKKGHIRGSNYRCLIQPIWQLNNAFKDILMKAHYWVPEILVVHIDRSGRTLAKLWKSRGCSLEKLSLGSSQGHSPRELPRDTFASVPKAFPLLVRLGYPRKTVLDL